MKRIRESIRLLKKYKYEYISYLEKKCISNEFCFLQHSVDMTFMIFTLTDTEADVTLTKGMVRFKFECPDFEIKKAISHH